MKSKPSDTMNHHIFQFSSAHKSLFIAALALCADAVWAETVEIRSAADWDNFAGRVNAGETTLDAVLVRDVTLSPDSPRCGTTQNRCYQGRFDGNGKTLTVNWTLANAGANNPAAPFAYAGKAYSYGGNEIHDLRVAGSIRTDGKFAGGIIGYVVADGRVILDRCRSSVEITCTIDGDTTSAGLVGCLGSEGDAFLTDCLFDGSLLGPTATSCGGLVGWRTGRSYAKAFNCLFAPAAVTVSATSGYTLVRGDFWATSHLKNSFYTLAYGTAQGTDASGMAAADLAAALGGNWEVVGGAAVPRMQSLLVEEVRDPTAGTMSFAYQGALRDAQGGPLGAGTHMVALRLYDQDTGGSPHWGRSFEVALDGNGLFNVRVGDESGEEIEGVNGVGLAQVISANAGSTLYVGLSVDGEEAEIMPRQKLIAVPFAFWAADAGATSGNLAAGGAVRTAGARVLGGLSAASASTAGAATAGTLAVAGRSDVAGDLDVSGAISGNGAIPLGAIVAWGGNIDDIPDGWALCDGQIANGRRTPDLRGRFVPGAGGAYRVGQTGGEERHTLAVSELPSHSHSYSFKGADLDLDWKNDNYFYDASGHYSGNGNTKWTASAGGGQSHENRPPFYAICYIMRVR